MKRYKTLPKEQDFFDRYAFLINQLVKTSFLSQAISAITEIGVIFTIIYKSIADFLPHLALPFAIIGAIIGTALLEVGLRVLLPYSARVFLFKRWKGLDLLMSIVILIATIGLLYASGTLSFKGSQDAVKAVTPPPTIQTTSAADSIKANAQQTAQHYFINDSTLIAHRYNDLITAKQAAYSAKIKQAQAVFDKYEQKEKTTGRKYTTHKANAQIKKAEKEAELRTVLADLRAAKSNELAEIQDERKERIASAETLHKSEVQSIKNDNEAAEKEAEQKADNYGLGVGYFTLICLIYLVLVVVLDEAHKKGSDIYEKAEPSQYSFDPSIFSELAAALKERLNYWTRSKIRAFADSTPAAPLPSALKNLYDRSDITMPVVQLKAQQHNKQSVIYLPQITAQTEETDPNEAIEYLTAAVALESQNKHQEAQKFILLAEDVLRLYLGTQATKKSIEQLKTQCVEHINGKGNNPFEHHHRRPIGFNTNATVNNAAVSNGKKNCLHCQKEYTPKVSWQKFCGKTCKEAYHAAKHNGKKFDPMYYKRRG